MQYTASSPHRFLSWDCANRSIAWCSVSANLDIFDKISKIADEFLAMFRMTAKEFTRLSRDDLQARIREKFSLKGHVAMLPGRPPINIMISPLARLHEMLDKFIRIDFIHAHDVLGHSINESSEMERTRALSRFLRSRPELDPELYTGPNITTVIEHQPPVIAGIFPGSRAGTNTKSTAIAHQLAFYYIECNPAFIDPKLKNNIAFAPHLEFNVFLNMMLPRYKNKKDAIYKARKEHSKANFLYFIQTFGLGWVLDGELAMFLDDMADSFMQMLAYIIRERLLTK